MSKLKREKMRILLVTQYFHPENFKSTDIAFELSKKGHIVTVLTGIPNYPAGKFFQGYGIFKKRKETINNVRIIRCLLWPRGKSSGFELALNYFSWAFFASLRGVFLAFSNKYDKIIVHEPSPITQGLPAIVIKRLIKKPIIFWVLDLWPDSLISAGNITNKRVLNFFEKLTIFIYNNCDKILISSKSFENSILDKGQHKSKVSYFPNWSKDLSLQDSSMSIPKLPEGFTVLFAGNIGEAQDMDTIVKACKLLTKEDNIRIVLIGDGRKSTFIEESISNFGLQNVLFAFGRFPIEYMATFYTQADSLLVSLKNEEAFTKTVPAKMQSYLSIKKPIIGLLNGEGSDLINEISCGYTAQAGNEVDFVRVLKQLANTDKATLDLMGHRGYDYFKSHFKIESSMNQLENVLYETK
jgi:glycosyltransferase involved in cell wall biosynthesis|uniref:glycosyltransferase family 4 protein n=1 Tax=Nonlabens sp. Ci31 TaxID=2608253 RepID=UPI001F0E61D6|nr:glycosyltransferase family 4 protein [Nonlabens sp. Ci31]